MLKILKFLKSKSKSKSRGLGPAADHLFVQANKKVKKNGLLIAREFRLFRARGSCSLIADSWAGLVTAAFNHGAWPPLAQPLSNAPDEKLRFSYWRIEGLRNWKNRWLDGILFRTGLKPDITNNY